MLNEAQAIVKCKSWIVQLEKWSSKNIQPHHAGNLLATKVSMIYKKHFWFECPHNYCNGTCFSIHTQIESILPWTISFNLNLVSWVEWMDTNCYPDIPTKYGNSHKCQHGCFPKNIFKNLSSHYLLLVKLMSHESSLNNRCMQQNVKWNWPPILVIIYMQMVSTFLPVFLCPHAKEVGCSTNCCHP